MFLAKDWQMIEVMPASVNVRTYPTGRQHHVSTAPAPRQHHVSTYPMGRPTNRSWVAAKAISIALLRVPRDRGPAWGVRVGVE